MISPGRRRQSSNVGCSTHNNHRSSTSHNIAEREGKAESKHLRSLKKGWTRNDAVRSLAVIVFVGFVVRTNVRFGGTQHAHNPDIPRQEERRGSGVTQSLETSKARSEQTVRASTSTDPQSSQLATFSSKTLIVDADDYIYKLNLSHFDAAPIIVPEYKLAFFSVPKVGCTTFKFLFRRMLGIKDWDTQDYRLVLPHNPRYNNLKYLWDYSLEQASEIMTSPEWTRAIFVREPKRRFLSAFLDKAIGNDGRHVIKACCHQALECGGIGPNRKKVNELLDLCLLYDWDSRHNVMVPQWNLELPCCPETKECREKALTIEGFLETIQTCHDEHWIPQSHRMETKYWKHINFVGHMETMKDDTKRLLEEIGAWEKWGATGWGPEGTASILEASEYSQSHTTNADTKILQWYTPEKERMVEAFYAVDYNNPVFEFKVTNLTQPVVTLPDGKFIKRGDKIYSRAHWDGAPVVVEKYKLVFFTIPKIGDTKWKQAFRRMMGHADWKEIGGDKGLPHDPATNDLKYLYHYSIEQAEEMIQSSEWTKALFIRSPKDRFLSVYYHMSRNRGQVDQRCCPHLPGCSSSLRTMIGFLELAENCYSTHWAPISERMEEKYWPYVNFVGSLENAEADSYNLLKRIGAWDAIGKTGWGENGDERLFATNSHAFNSVLDSLSMYNPTVDKMLDSFYKADFDSKYLNFASKKVYAMEH